MAKVLVIDDSGVMRSFLADFLAELGHEVLTASDGLRGVETAKTEQIDLCICDIHMPRKNGPQVYKELSVHDPQIQFIFTDSMPDRISEQITGTASVSYLRKPFELIQIRELIERLLKPVEKR